MDAAYITSLIENDAKVAELKAGGFFLSSIMAVVPSLGSAAENPVINFYHAGKNEIASFSAESEKLVFSGLSPPMSSVQILPLGINRVSVSAEDAMKSCAKHVQEEMLSRVVCVLRTSTNSKSENGPCWHISAFLKTLSVVSVLIDAENGQTLATTKKKLSV